MTGAVEAPGGGQMLWLWMFIKTPGWQVLSRTGWCGKASRGNRQPSLKNQTDGRGVQHKHDDDVKQGKIASPESAAPLPVSRHLASVEPGDGFVAL